MLMCLKCSSNIYFYFLASQMPTLYCTLLLFLIFAYGILQQMYYGIISIYVWNYDL